MQNLKRRTSIACGICWRAKRSITKQKSGSVDSRANWINRGLTQRESSFICLVGNSRRSPPKMACSRLLINRVCPSSVPASWKAASRFEKKNNFQFDIVQDVLDMAQIAIRARVSGVINIGGGITKSFLRQTEMSAHIFKQM